MPYLKRSFTYKDDKKALCILKQGMFIEDLSVYPQFVQNLLKNGNYLTEEEVDPDKGIMKTSKPQIPVKLEHETHAKTIKIADLSDDEPEESVKKSPKKTKDGLIPLDNVVTQQGASIPLNESGDIKKVNQDLIDAVKGSDIKVAETLKKVSDNVEMPKKVSDNADIPDTSIEGEGVLVVNKNPKPRPQGKRNKNK